MEEQPAAVSRIGCIAVCVIAGVLLPIALPKIAQMRADAKKSHSLNNLRQLAHSALNYESAFQRFPTAVNQTADSEFPQGWEVTLLPFLEASNLPCYLRQDEPWDGPRNSAHCSFAHPAFLNPLEQYQRDEQGYGLSHYAANSEMIPLTDTPVTLDQLEGQPPAMFGEICDGYQPWAQPGNARPIANGIHFDANSFGSPYFQGAAVAYADGSTEFVESSSIRPPTKNRPSFKARANNQLGGRSNITFCHEAYFSPAVEGHIIYFRSYDPTDEFAKHKQDCRSDDINSWSVTDEGLQQLKKLDNLKGVDLGFGSKVTNAGVLTLSELSQLEYLSLGNVEISDTELSALRKLDNLKLLEVNLNRRNKSLSQEALAEFQQAFPNCQMKITDFPSSERP